MPDALSGLLDRQPHARAVLGGVSAGTHELSHAYLITGPPGSGKERLARELAAAALAAPRADGPIAPAAVDDHLRTQLARGVHPDCAWVEPTSGAGILVDDVEQQVLAAAGSTPLVAARRVFVIEQCDRLHEAAANRLLKTIEEPPPYVHLLLLSSSPGDVLATIASRCQTVRLLGPTQGELVANLERGGAGDELARSAAAIAGADADLAALLADPELGRPLREAAEGYAAGALLGDVTQSWQPLLERADAAASRASDAVHESAARTLELLEGRDKSQFEKAVEARAKRAARLAKTDELDLGLRLTGTWLRDLWAMALGAGDVVRAIDRTSALHAALAGIAATEEERPVAAQRLAEVVAAVERARGALRVNASEALLLDALAIRISAIAHGRPLAA